LKTLLSRINGSVSLIVMIASLRGIANLSSYFTDIFDPTVGLFRVVIISNYAIFLISFTLAADANRKVNNSLALFGLLK